MTEQSVNRRVRRIKRIKKGVLYAAAVLVLYLLFSDPHATLFGARPNLMLPLVACCAMFEGPLGVGGLAAICGLLTDTVQQTPFGVNALLFFVLGMLLWGLFRFLLRPVLINGFFASLLLTFAFQGVDFLLVYGQAGELFLRTHLLNGLVGAVFSFAFFYPVRLVYERLRFVV